MMLEVGDFIQLEFNGNWHYVSDISSPRAGLGEVVSYHHWVGNDYQVYAALLNEIKGLHKGGWSRAELPDVEIHAQHRLFPARPAPSLADLERHQALKDWLS